MYFTTIFFFNFKVKVKVLGAQSCPTLGTPWTVACQAPLFIGFFREEYCSGLPFPSPEDLPWVGKILWRGEYCSGLPFPSPEDLPDPGIEPRSLTLLTDSLPPEPPGKPNFFFLNFKITYTYFRD